MGSWFSVIMVKATALCVLLVVGLVKSAPQISSTEVVRTVTTQLQPLTRDVQDGAVQMRNIPGPWQGPYADTVPAGVTGAAAVTGVTSTRGSSSTSTIDQSALIARILAQLQPQISGAVQSAIASSTTSTRAVGSSTGIETVFSGDNSVKIQTPEFNIAY